MTAPINSENREIEELRAEVDWQKKVNTSLDGLLRDTSAQLSTAQEEIKRLLEVIKKAPHSYGCDSMFELIRPCNCWKSRALSPELTKIIEEIKQANNA